MLRKLALPPLPALARLLASPCDPLLLCVEIADLVPALSVLCLDDDLCLTLPLPKFQLRFRLKQCGSGMPHDSTRICPIISRTLSAFRRSEG